LGLKNRTPNILPLKTRQGGGLSDDRSRQCFLHRFLSELHALHIDLFLHQQGLDTTTPGGKAMFQMMGVFAEFERAMIAERVRVGLRRAKDEGKQLGRPRIAPELEKRIQTALNERKRTGEGVRGIAKRFGVDPSTVQRISRPFDGVAA
jgi:DNA invertase Pin-like site-specific DNA recombinase